MKFLLVVIAIRYVVLLLNKMNEEEKMEEGSEGKKLIHPSEFRTRW